MSLELVPGADNVVRFPRERRSGPEAETLHDIGPPQADIHGTLGQ